MPQQRRQKVEFTADKPVSKPVGVEFYTKDGEKVFGIPRGRGGRGPFRF